MKYLFLTLLFISNITFAQQPSFSCGVSDNDISEEAKEAMKKLPTWISERKLRTKALDDFYFCRVAVDVDYQTFKQFNEDTMSIKNEVAIMIQKASQIYEKEINTKLILVNVNIWKEQSKDPYNNISDIFQLLDKVRVNYTNTNLSKIASDVVMYLPSKGFTGAGGVASGKFNVSPWAGISTISHEIGHNFSSPHTQSCNWPGGAIDFCYAVEGSCYNAALEEINGTLMSYCGRRLNTFHPLCIELMNRYASTRFLKISVIQETVKLPDTFNPNLGGFLNWQATNYAENYTIEASTTDDFKNIAFRDTVLQSYTVLSKLKQNQTYFIRIQPSNRLGKGSWSNTLKVSTAENYLETPQLNTPKNMAINVDGSSITLAFQAVNKVQEYQIQYITFSSSNTSYTFDFPTSTRRITTNTFSMSTSSEAITWRVRSVRGNEFGPWSAPFTFWTKPNSSAIDLVHQAINGYPNTFPINYIGNLGNVLEVKAIISESKDYTNPIFTKTWPTSKFPGQNNYPILLEKLKPNTTYYVKFEESNLAEQNIISMPKGLVRFSEKSFKTGTDETPASFAFFLNSNISEIGRLLRRAAYNEDYAFIASTEGISRMKFDGTENKVFNRDNTNGLISNTLIDFKTDDKGDLWILSKISKRIAFDGVFPKTTYRLARFNPKTMQQLEANDFFGGENASFTTFDPETKYLSNGIYFHKIIKDSTQKVFTLPINNSSVGSTQWSKDIIWNLVFNSTTRIYEIVAFEKATSSLKVYNKDNSPLNSIISYIYTDSIGNLWISQTGSTPLLKWTKENGFRVVSNYNLTTNPRIIGENNGTLYLFVAPNIVREIYALSNDKLRKVVAFPFVNTTGNYNLDKAGKIWIQQSEKLIKINPCADVKSPEINANKVQLLKGESTELTATGCTSVVWSWVGEGQNSETKTILDSPQLTVNPSVSTTYRARCIDQDCVGEFSKQVSVNVLSIELKSSLKSKYCSNENISITPVIQGNYADKNEFKAKIYNASNSFTVPIANQSSISIPNTISNGKYWLKIEATEPKVTSKDSVEVNIFQAPTAQISGLKEMYLFDSTQISILYTGTPPFKIKYLNENIIENSFTTKRLFSPTEPINYVLSISDLSDANCPSGIIASKDFSIKATVNPKFQNYWVLSYPNPVENVLNLHVYNKPGKELQYEIYDVRGVQVLKDSFPIKTYLDKYSFDFSSYGSGVYFLKLNTGIRKEIRRIIKQ